MIRSRPAGSIRKVWRAAPPCRTSTIPSPSRNTRPASIPPAGTARSATAPPSMRSPPSRPTMSRRHSGSPVRMACEWPSKGRGTTISADREHRAVSSYGPTACARQMCTSPSAPPAPRRALTAGRRQAFLRSAWRRARAGSRLIGPSREVAEKWQVVGAPPSARPAVSPWVAATAASPASSARRPATCWRWRWSRRTVPCWWSMSTSTRTCSGRCEGAAAEPSASSPGSPTALTGRPSHSAG
jgi:hypothetical protein